MPPTPTQRRPHRSLLLLPPAPAPPTYAALQAAYGPSILQVLRQLSSSARKAQEPQVLDIALPCPHLYGRLNEPRGPLYAATQSLVANIYKLICVIAAKDAIDTEGAASVDARVVLVAYPRHGQLVQTPETPSAEQDVLGPAIDLRTLARSPRSWDTVFADETKEGQRFLENFVASGSSERNIARVAGGTVQSAEADTPSSVDDAFASTKHSAVAVGGTFDHLHIGHKLLLTMFAFVLASRGPSAGDQVLPSLTVGITGDELLKNKKYQEILESWDHRQEGVHDFLDSIIHFGQPDDSTILTERKTESGPNGHAVHVTYPSKLVIKYVQIMDPFGPTITDESISALVISKETRSGGKAVNDKREEKGWHPLEVFEVDVLDAGEEEVVDETFQSKLSSSEIRRILTERARPTAHA